MPASDVTVTPAEQHQEPLLRAMSHPVLIRASGKIAGFAIVDQVSRLTGDRDATDMAEFFVVRRWRRHGVGGAAGPHHAGQPGPRVHHQALIRPPRRACPG
ncbi:MAG TPA: hypothetical protein VFX16_06565 [Pseudonocardiaceae bacterium]|nr:hypothetical protein [Pseudonocardiaceae bacterium]